MRRALAILACIIAVTLAPGMAMAQPDATPSEAPTTTLTTDDDDGDGRPWWRLSYGIPLAALSGAGAIVVRRVLQRRGAIGG